MGSWRGRIAVWTLLAVGQAHAVAAAAPERRMVVVQLENRSLIRPQDLAVARAEVERVFSAAGVDLLWEGDWPLARHLHLALIDNAPQGGGNPFVEILGEASRATGRAYVYRDRVDAQGGKRQCDERVVLGRVMAHEIGHLLLPSNSHSAIGIMRPHANLNLAGYNQFTTDQAERIRSSLR